MSINVDICDIIGLYNLDFSYFISCIIRSHISETSPKSNHICDNDSKEYDELLNFGDRKLHTTFRRQFIRNELKDVTFNDCSYTQEYYYKDIILNVVGYNYMFKIGNTHNSIIFTTKKLNQNDDDHYYNKIIALGYMWLCSKSHSTIYEFNKTTLINKTHIIRDDHIWSKLINIAARLSRIAIAICNDNNLEVYMNLNYEDNEKFIKDYDIKLSAPYDVPLYNFTNYF